MPPSLRVRGQTKSITKRLQRKYQRYAKPPYSYVGMICATIQSAPQHKLTLAEIHRDLEKMFPFFAQEYDGWKDSVRHNLSNNECFVKVLRDACKPSAKRNYWTVDQRKIPIDAYLRQETVVSRQGNFAKDLRDELKRHQTQCKQKASFPETLHEVKTQDKYFQDMSVIPSKITDINNSSTDKSKQTTLSFSIDNILSENFKGYNSKVHPGLDTDKIATHPVNNNKLSDLLNVNYATGSFTHSTRCEEDFCQDFTRYYSAHVTTVPMSHTSIFKTLPAPIVTPSITCTPMSTFKTEATLQESGIGFQYHRNPLPPRDDTSYYSPSATSDIALARLYDRMYSVSPERGYDTYASYNPLEHFADYALSSYHISQL